MDGALSSASYEPDLGWVPAFAGMSGEMSDPQGLILKP